MLALKKCQIIFPVNKGKQTNCSATYSVFGSSVLATFAGSVPRHVTSRGARTRARESPCESSAVGDTICVKPTGGNFDCKQSGQQQNKPCN